MYSTTTIETAGNSSPHFNGQDFQLNRLKESSLRRVTQHHCVREVMKWQISFVRNTVVGFLFLLLLSTVDGFSVHKATEGDNIHLQWDSDSAADLSRLYMTCHFNSGAPRLVFEMERGEESSRNQDPQFSGRVQCVKEVLAQGHIHILFTRLTLQDSGYYTCDMTLNKTKGKFFKSEDFVVNVTSRSFSTVMNPRKEHIEDPIQTEQTDVLEPVSTRTRISPFVVLAVVVLVAVMIICVMKHKDHKKEEKVSCILVVKKSRQTRGEMEWIQVYLQISSVLITGASSKYVSMEYHLINLSMSWLDAQSYCRLKHLDLLTIRNKADQDHMMELLEPNSPDSVWIGLKRTSTRHWRWSDGNGTLRTNFWGDGEPNNVGGIDWCVEMRPDGTWNDVSCNELTGFVCYELNGTWVRFAHYSSKVTWRSAQSTCRKNHADLVTVTSAETNSEVQGLLFEGQTAWIGLFSDAWEWSDRNITSYRSWMEGGDSDGECAAVASGGYWVAMNCAQRKPFVCEGRLNARKTSVKMTMSTLGDLNPELVIAHLHTQLRNHNVSDVKLSWKRGKDHKIFQRQSPANINKRVCDRV
ncbi:hypothetical protein WMY93_015098 [Mugilogobius chulae]|uniref:C-type lectin domain-containing protein n=1 Tax=Mugilogobius chulae TaxID=88201 RepID=A0AAW0NYR0_9GOBI